MSLIDAVQIRKSYSARAKNDVPQDVLKDVSLQVSAGELVTIVGPSGSGKSTLLYCLAGLEQPDQGTISIGGVDLSSLSPTQMATFRRENFGFVFQAYNLIPYLSALQNVELPQRLAHRAARRRIAADALNQVGLAPHTAKRPGELSGGQQQRVALARAFASRPAILFADEPTGALDTASGATVLSLLRQYAGDGRSVVMVTHDLEAAALGDRVLVMRDGQIHRELHAPDATAVLTAVHDAGERTGNAK